MLVAAHEMQDPDDVLKTKENVMPHIVLLPSNFSFF